jgi:diguanylate cyclase (GGDEF)-like protein
VVTYKRGGTWFSTTSPYYFGAAALLVAHGPAMLAAAVSTAGSFASIWVRRARSLSLGIANSAMDIPSFVAAKLVYDAVLSASGFPSAPVLGGVLVVLTLDLIQHLIMAVHSAAGGYMSLTRAVVEHCFNVHVWVMRAVQGLAVGLALAAPGVPGVWAALASGIVMHVLLERIGRTRHAVAAGSSCPLTGLVTHASFQAELREVLRGHAPVGLLMVDIDYFKQLNDARGHLEGDRVLREVAGAIVSCISIADTASRYGGEEFAVIVPGADREVISVIGERIRGEVETRCGVTVSVGGAVALPGADAAVLIEAADAALYASKAAGRNRVTVVPEPVEKREGAGPVVAVQEVGRR